MSRAALARKELMKARQNAMGSINAPGFSSSHSRSIDDASNSGARIAKANELDIHGNPRTYNLNTLLHQNILNSEYFKALYDKRTYHEIIDEIYYQVTDHMEPLSPGTARTPSTGFCLLVKLCTMRLTVKQMQGLLDHVDSPYIRCIGFLYLRYTCPPEDLWKWFHPYLEDSEEFTASASGCTSSHTTIGEWLRQLLEEQQYFGTLLPRIPKKILDTIKIKFLLLDQKKKRREENLKSRVHQNLRIGSKVRAMYEDEDNEPAMYEAIIDSIIEPQDDSFYQYWVTFPEYGNKEKIDLGDIEHPDLAPGRCATTGKGRSRSRSRSHPRSFSNNSSKRRRQNHSSSYYDDSSEQQYRRAPSRQRRSRSSRSRSRSPRVSGTRYNRISTTEELRHRVQEEERNKAAAKGKDYAQRPTSYKGSLSLKMDRYTTRDRR